MKLVVNVLAALVALTGFVFFLQGSNILVSDSFMVGSPQWQLIGLVMLIIGGGLLFINNRRRAQS